MLLILITWCPSFENSVVGSSWFTEWWMLRKTIRYRNFSEIFRIWVCFVCYFFCCFLFIFVIKFVILFTLNCPKPAIIAARRRKFSIFLYLRILPKYFKFVPQLPLPFSLDISNYRCKLFQAWKNIWEYFLYNFKEILSTTHISSLSVFCYFLCRFLFIFVIVAVNCPKLSILSEISTQYWISLWTYVWICDFLKYRRILPKYFYLLTVFRNYLCHFIFIYIHIVCKWRCISPYIFPNLLFWQKYWRWECY